MGKLVPFNKKVQKQMGWVNTKQGPMIDSSRLVNDKKFVKKAEPVKVVRESAATKQKKEEAKKETTRLESRGVYQ